MMDLPHSAHPHLNREHNLMFLVFIPGKNNILEELTAIFFTTLQTVVRLLTVLLKIWLFPNTNIFITANPNQTQQFPRLLVGSSYQEGNLADLTNYSTVAGNCWYVPSSHPFPSSFWQTRLSYNFGEVSKALLKLRCVTSAAPLVSAEPATKPQKASTQPVSDCIYIYIHTKVLKRPFFLA